MVEPIVTLSLLFDELPGPLYGSVLDRCCKALGLPGNPIDVVTFEILSHRIRTLVVDMGLSEFLLIPGLLQMAIDSFESDAVDLERVVASEFASMIQQVGGNFDMLPESIKKLLTEAGGLQNLCENAQEVLRIAPDEIAMYRRDAEMIRELKLKHFPLEFWNSSIRKLQD